MDQNLSAFNIAVVVMVAQGNTLLDLQSLMPNVLESLPKAKPGEAMLVSRETCTYRKLTDK